MKKKRIIFICLFLCIGLIYIFIDKYNYKKIVSNEKNISTKITSSTIMYYKDNSVVELEPTIMLRLSNRVYFLYNSKLYVIVDNDMNSIPILLAITVNNIYLNENNNKIFAEKNDDTTIKKNDKYIEYIVSNNKIDNINFDDLNNSKKTIHTKDNLKSFYLLNDNLYYVDNSEKNNTILLIAKNVSDIVFGRNNDQIIYAIKKINFEECKSFEFIKYIDIDIENISNISSDIFEIKNDIVNKKFYLFNNNIYLLNLNDNSNKLVILSTDIKKAFVSNDTLMVLKGTTTNILVEDDNVNYIE